jgi:N-acetylneuraminic acid mutarotase
MFLLALAVCAIPLTLAQRNATEKSVTNRSEAPANVSQRTLTFAERVAYQRAIEDIYWRQRLWPKERPDHKPSLDAVMSQAQLKKKVADYLQNSQALEDYWNHPITAEQLQAEMNRIAQDTRQPEVLREIFEALGNDPFVVAECLARPVLAERLLTNFSERLESWRGRAKNQMPRLMVRVSANYTLPTVSDGPSGCIEDTWTATSTTNAPCERSLHTAVWTGSEMIVWGGAGCNDPYLDTGGRYNPATDSWAATSLGNAPFARAFHTAVWTGTEMIVWGGAGFGVNLNTGGRYNPTTNTWTATSVNNAPSERYAHAAVWTGSEMIVWGGYNAFVGQYFSTGGRYDPSTDSWTATTTTNAPAGRYFHTGVWSGSEMIVWGGDENGVSFNTGGRYNPSTNSWTATSTTNAPEGRSYGTTVWTGSEMIVWGGLHSNSIYLDSGGRYNPSTDSWSATSTANVPDARTSHTAVWTGSEMIIWGGFLPVIFTPTNTGGRYDPITDSWTATSTTNAPSARAGHTAVWSGNEMIVWGAAGDTGGRYCAQSGPTTTPTPTPTASPTPTLTPTPCTGRCSPTPRPRPTPQARPSPP